MMETNSNNETWFEQVLRTDLNSADIDYNAVEKHLLLRIDQTVEMGELSLLKMDEIIPAEKFQQIEKNLFSQITHYKEYEEPVNECIISDLDLTNSQWERLEAKLFSKIEDSSMLPMWEQLLMMPQDEPLCGDWERIEERITEDINKSDTQEPWVLCARNEEVCVPALIEKEEQLLNEKLAEKDISNIWVNELKREVVLSLDQLDKIEDSLISRIEKEKSQMPLAKQPFWSFIDHYLTVLRPIGTVTALFLFFIGGFAGLQYYSRSTVSVPTVAYQVNGASVIIPQFSENVGQSCESVDGGFIKLVNKYGTVDLQNRSRLELLKVTEKTAQYRVSFDKNSTAKSMITFLVNKHSPDEKFRISTDDYQIIVKGTYFQIEPGQSGSVTTKVLEGVIRIVNKDFGEIEVREGQIFEFDPSEKRYTIRDGGRVVQRSDIETAPDIHTLINCKVLRLNANVTGADIFINGRFSGVTPAAIRHQTGGCKIRINKEGYNTLDTTIFISEDYQDYEVAAVLQEKVNPVAIKKEIKKRHIIGTEKSEINQPEQISDPVITPEQISAVFSEPDSAIQPRSDESYIKAQKEELAGNWKNAIDLYQKVFDDQNASRLSREDALFSIGRLKADNVYNPAEASQVFLTYLALYPGGSFAGESWLRLAELEFRKKPENSTQYYENFFKMFPQHPRIVELKNRVGAIYLQQKRYDEAIDMFKQALNTNVSLREQERKVISANLDRALQEKMQSSKALVNQ